MIQLPVIINKQRHLNNAFKTLRVRIWLLMQEFTNLGLQQTLIFQKIDTQDIFCHIDSVINDTYFRKQKCI